MRTFDPGSKICICALVGAIMLHACASSPVTYVRRMGYLESRLESLERQGWVEVLTPSEFERARNAYKLAGDLIRKGGDPAAIVNEISRAEVNFILAENRTKRLQEEFPRLVESRRRALAQASDSRRGDELEKIDQRLRNLMLKQDEEGAPLSRNARRRLAEDYASVAEGPRGH